MQRLFRQFSFPGGIPSHAAPETPGSIHEGGELGYSLAHAYGAAFDNPDLVVACVIGDGEAETGRWPGAGTRTSSGTPARMGRAADPPPQRLQDRQPVVPGPHPAGRADQADGGLRLPPLRRRGRRPRRGPPADGEHPGRRLQRDRDPAGTPADDHPRDPEGVDRAEGGRREARRRDVAGPSGAALGGRGPTPAIWSSSRNGCRRTGRKSSSTATAGPIPRSSGWSRRGPGG